MPPARITAAVGLVSCALILLQISFTRLIGYKLFYHFVFLAIALSLLGLGAAGTYVAVRREPSEVGSVVRRWLGVVVALVPVAFVAMANPPFIWESRLPIKLLGADAVQYLAWCAVFMVALNFAGGVVLTQVFRRHSEHMGRLYSADLVGAGIGCVIAVGLMKYFSAPAAFLFATVLAFVAQLPFLRTEGARRERWLAGAAGACGLLLAVGVLLGPEDVRSFENFERTVRPKPHVFKYEWNHIIRTDHVPGHYILDGEAATGIVRWDDAQRRLPVDDPAYVVAVPRPRVGIIGFGGGAQLAEARRAGASHIVGIEINPTISRWVLNEDRVLNFGLFVDPSIEVITAEGRHAIRSQRRKFDVLIMHAVDTYAATVVGAYALSENFLYTKEAMLDYLAALNPGGVMSIQRWLFNPPRENMRLFTTALEALEELRVPEPHRHLMMLAPIHDYELLRQRRARIWGYFLLSPTPFTEAQVARIRAHVAARRWSVLYAPGGNEQTAFTRYVETEDRQAFRRAYPYLISPVTDARPYLFQFYDPLHQSAYRVEGDWAVSAIYQSSAIMLLTALGASLLASLLIIIAPLAWASWRVARASGQRRDRLGAPHVVFFTCLGVGFMALEVPLTQVVALYLGHPTYGFSLVLVALLLASGIGSLVSQRLGLPLHRVCALVGGLLGLTTVFIFPIVHGTIGLPDPLRFTLAILLVVLCGLPMGLPLALAVEGIGRGDSQNVAWAWAINAAASVVGSCLVMVVMVFWETRAALALAAVCYGVASVVSHWLPNPPRQQPPEGVEIYGSNHVNATTSASNLSR